MVFTYRGRKVRLNLPKGTGNVAKKIKKGRFYEKKCLDYIAKLNLDGVFVDVGANIGNHSVYFGMFTQANKVLSFEPNPAVYKVLKENIKNNKLEKIIIPYNVALGEKVGKVDLEIVPRDEIGGTKVVPGTSIDQWKLDKFVNEKISLIKVDVEGFEEFVVKGSKQVLQKHKPELFLELSTKQQYNQIFKILKKYGYQPVGVFNNTATYHFSSKQKSGTRYHLSRIYPLRRAFLYS